MGNFNYIKNKVLAVFETHFETRDVTEDTRILEDLGADSLDMYDICISIEDLIPITLSDTDILRIIKSQTINDVINTVYKRYLSK